LRRQHKGDATRPNSKLKRTASPGKLRQKRSRCFFVPPHKAVVLCSGLRAKARCRIKGSHLSFFRSQSCTANHPPFILFQSAAKPAIPGLTACLYFDILFLVLAKNNIFSK
jgi:hypothetical protein